MALPVNLQAVVDEMDNLAPKRSQPPSQHPRLGRFPDPIDALDGEKKSCARHARSTLARREQPFHQQPRRRFEAGGDATALDCLRRHQRYADRCDPGQRDLEAPKHGSGRDRRFDGFGKMR